MDEWRRSERVEIVTRMVYRSTLKDTFVELETGKLIRTTKIACRNLRSDDEISAMTLLLILLPINDFSCHPKEE